MSLDIDRKKVALLTDFAGPLSFAMAWLEKKDFAGEIELRPFLGVGSDIPARFFDGCDAIITRPGSPKLLPESLVKAAKQLVIGTVSVGQSHLKEVKGMPGMEIITAEGTNSEGTGTLAITLAEQAFRPIHIGQESMANGFFDRRPFDQSRRIEGLHWLAIGAGSVVQSMIWDLLARMPYQITVCNRTMDLDRMALLLAELPASCRGTDVITNSDGVYSATLRGRGNRTVRLKGVRTSFAGPATQIPELAEADVVSLHVDPVPETMRLVGREFLQQMKPGAILVNVGRGELINESAVIEYLETEHLYAFAADVLDELVEGNKLHTMSELWNRYVSDKDLPIDQRLRLVLTPHVGGHVFPDIKRTVTDVLRKMFTRLGVNADSLGDQDEGSSSPD